MAEFNVKFVSQKISKVRWRPTPKQSLQQSDVFATGSWDDKENKLTIWRLEQLSKEEAMVSGASALLDNEPQLLCEVQHCGDVTDLSYISQELVAAASSTGSVTLFRHHTNSQTLGVSHQWDSLHKYGDRPCPCTCLASRGDEMIVTGGEDGRVAVLMVGQRQPVKVLERADSCTINSIAFLKQSEILTVNSFGQLKIFDMRQNTEEPSKTYSVTEEHTSLQCVDKHPGQPHIVATGGQDGMLTIWDLRQEKFPMTLLEAHSATMWEVKFHPSNPDHLFTCSDDGSLWHWDGSAVSTNPVSLLPGGSLLGTGAGVGGGNQPLTPFSKSASSSHVSPWLTLESSRHKLEITSLLPTKSLPVNSLDIEGNTLLCGTDSETLYTVNLSHLR